MICLFEKDAGNYTGNGICVLNPTSCVVSEIAGGSYLLHMEHPIDDEGKWMMLTDERIIKAPVPPMHVQSFTLPDVMVWQVKQTVESANLYTVLPSYKRIPCPDAIKKVKQNPSAYAYNDNVVYKRGEYCSFRGGIYHVVSDYSYRVLPTSQAATWAYDTTVAGSGDRTEESGGTYTTIAAGTQVAKIADYNGTYMQVRVLQGGNVGYIERELCEETQTEESGPITDPQEIADYIFAHGQLPDNFITKEEAKALGWDSGRNYVGDVAPGKSIGGDRFGNYQGQLPKAKGRKFYECDVNYKGKKRGEERIIYSNDGHVWYTKDHYETFEELFSSDR